MKKFIGKYLLLYLNAFVCWAIWFGNPGLRNIALFLVVVMCSILFVACCGMVWGYESCVVKPAREHAELAEKWRNFPSLSYKIVKLSSICTALYIIYSGWVAGGGLYFALSLGLTLLQMVVKQDLENDKVI